MRSDLKSVIHLAFDSTGGASGQGHLLGIADPIRGGKKQFVSRIEKALEYQIQGVLAAN